MNIDGVDYVSKSALDEATEEITRLKAQIASLEADLRAAHGQPRAPLGDRPRVRNPFGSEEPVTPPPPQAPFDPRDQLRDLVDTIERGLTLILPTVKGILGEKKP